MEILFQVLKGLELDINETIAGKVMYKSVLASNSTVEDFYYE
jgi:hypothetical protein